MYHICLIYHSTRAQCWRRRLPLIIWAPTLPTDSSSLWCSSVHLHALCVCVGLSDGRQGFMVRGLCYMRSKLWYFHSESQFHWKTTVSTPHLQSLADHQPNMHGTTANGLQPYCGILKLLQEHLALVCLLCHVGPDQKDPGLAYNSCSSV